MVAVWWGEVAGEGSRFDGIQLGPGMHEGQRRVVYCPGRVVCVCVCVCVSVLEQVCPSCLDAPSTNGKRDQRPREVQSGRRERRDGRAMQMLCTWNWASEVLSRAGKDGQGA